MGMLDGGLTPFEVVRAVAALKGEATTNLKVRMAKDVTIGDRTWRKGEEVPTGLDVPKGGAFIIGIKSFYDRGHLRMGITCALCHAAVDPASGKVIEGAPNADLNAGLLMALAKNSSAYFMHASVPEANGGTPAEGNRPALPDAAAVEAATKIQVASWPPGSFDSSGDRVTNPTSIPSSFSAYGEPYSWSGRERLGPFGGLSSLNNNVHAANSDTTQLAAAAPWLFGLDPETYLGIVLRGAPEGPLRYDPAGSLRPSEVLRTADPTPASPGLNSYAVLPTYPATNYMTDNGLFASVSGEPANYANNAMSAFQNLLRPPVAQAEAGAVRAGRAVFERAGCGACHSGPALTNHRVIPEAEIGTEPSRAKAGAKMEARLSPRRCSRPIRPSRFRPIQRSSRSPWRTTSSSCWLGARGERRGLQGSEPRRPRLDRPLPARFRRGGGQGCRQGTRRARYRRPRRRGRSGQQPAGAGRSRAEGQGHRRQCGIAEEPDRPGHGPGPCLLGRSAGRLQRGRSEGSHRLPAVHRPADGGCPDALNPVAHASSAGVARRSAA